MKLSIIIPCHNGAAYLGQTIGSVLEQTRQPFEIIVVVDNSSDDSAAIALNFGPPVKVCEVRFGMASKTRNFGARLAKGDALLFLDADDVLAPNALLGLEEALENNPKGVAFIPWNRLELSDGRWVERKASIPPKTPGEDMLSSWLTGRYYPPCCLLWSRDAFERIGGWSEEYCPNDDGDLACRALILEIPFAPAKEGLAYYRRIPELDSLSGTRFSKKGLAARLRVWEKLAAWIEERGRLGRYRFPLGYSLGEIRRDAKRQSVASIVDRCEQWFDLYQLRDGNLVQKGLRKIVRMRNRLIAKLGLHRNPYRHTAVDIEIVSGLAAYRRSIEHPSRTRERIDPKSLPSNPKVSVIIPTYNRAQLVKRAIESALQQSFRDLEVIVVDDASTDDTEKAVKAIADPRLRYLKQSENRDVSAARNRGLREARGEFIAFLDSDDEWLEGKLEAQLERFQTLPESVGLVYSGSIQRYDDGSERFYAPQCRGNALREILERNITDTGSASVVIRRNVIRVVGFFDEEIPAMEDYDYWIRIARFYDFDFVPQPLVRYYEIQRADRRSLIPDSDKAARSRLYAKYQTLLQRYGLTHTFYQVSVHRLLHRYRQRDRIGALILALKAIKANPKAKTGYSLTLQSIVPSRVWQSARRPLEERRRNTTRPA